MSEAAPTDALTAALLYSALHQPGQQWQVGLTVAHSILQPDPDVCSTYLKNSVPGMRRSITMFPPFPPVLESRLVACVRAFSHLPTSPASYPASCHLLRSERCDWR
jgi:hypothetical protein